MMSRMRITASLTLAALAAMIPSTIEASPGKRARADLILENVSVVDTRTGAVLPRRAVLIAGGRIIDIVPAGDRRTSGPAQRVDLSGKFVVPGYNDMHVHSLLAPSPATSLPLMLVNGITGVRQMSGSPELLAARRAGKPILPPASPELLAMPGAIIVPGASGTPETVRQEIRKQKREGADFIKLADADRETYLAALDEARRLRLPIVGHLIPKVDVREAIRHGMTGIEHFGPGVSVLASCSSDEATIRRVFAAMPDMEHALADTPPEILQRQLANPMLFVPSAALKLTDRVVATKDTVKCAALARDLASAGMWQVPTLTRLEAMEIGDSTAFRGNPDNMLVPARSRALWLTIADEFAAKRSPADREILRKLFDAQLSLTKGFDDAQVRMMTGTDFGGSQWIVPSSLHHEFELLGRAGLSPFRILQMTTINPARFLGREAVMGTVERGRNANLVVLDADPRANVENLRRIAAVVRAGKLYTRTDLDALERASKPQ